ncbi:MAG: LacI family DNA-binding transcriptional regulator [Anaerolineae bacterium]|nr:LacI family DNA-binding transcriptional regulator [Anaerolineae bacterium]
MPTMIDVAKRAGVAVSTVSYAINGTRPISEETRQRIFAAMEDLDYKPNALARGLAGKRSRIIALLCAAPDRGLGFTELGFITSAADTARENEYNLLLWSLDANQTDELRQLIQQGLADGVIVMEVHLHDERVDLLNELEFPFSIIGRCDDLQNHGYVDIDFHQTAYDAVRYLIELGHTQIALINQSQRQFEAGYGPAVRMQHGFEAVMHSYDLPILTRFCPVTPQEGYRVCCELVAENPDLTSMVVMNERAIPGIIQAITEYGWRIPEDFSLLSLVSSPNVAQMSIPPLTSLDSPNTELGRLGAEQLIQQLEAVADHPPPRKLLPCYLNVRGSTGPARA